MSAVLRPWQRRNLLTSGARLPRPSLRVRRFSSRSAALASGVSEVSYREERIDAAHGVPPQPPCLSVATLLEQAGLAHPSPNNASLALPLPISTLQIRFRLFPHRISHTAHIQHTAHPCAAHSPHGWHTLAHLAPRVLAQSAQPPWRTQPQCATAGTPRIPRGSAQTAHAPRPARTAQPHNPTVRATHNGRPVRTARTALTTPPPASSKGRSARTPRTARSLCAVAAANDAQSMGPTSGVCTGPGSREEGSHWACLAYQVRRALAPSRRRAALPMSALVAHIEHDLDPAGPACSRWPSPPCRCRVRCVGHARCCACAAWASLSHRTHLHSRPMSQSDGHCWWCRPCGGRVVSHVCLSEARSVGPSQPVPVWAQWHSRRCNHAIRSYAEARARCVRATGTVPAEAREPGRVQAAPPLSATGRATTDPICARADTLLRDAAAPMRDRLAPIGAGRASGVAGKQAGGASDRPSRRLVCFET